MSHASEPSASPDPSRPVRVMVVSPSPLARVGVRALVEAGGLVVCGDGQTAIEALHRSGDVRPDIAVLHVQSDSARAALGELAASVDGVRAVVITALHESRAHVEAIEAGAMGVVMDQDAPESLLKAVVKVHAGELWLDRRSAAAFAHAARVRRLDRDAPDAGALTRRELEIVRLLCFGLKNRDIAARLFISDATVRNHLTSILSKLGLSDRFELAVYAFRHGLADTAHDLDTVPAEAAARDVANDRGRGRRLS